MNFTCWVSLTCHVLCLVLPSTLSYLISISTLLKSYSYQRPRERSGLPEVTELPSGGAGVPEKVWLTPQSEGFVLLFITFKKDGGVEYDSRPKLSFAKPGLCFLVSPNAEKLLQNSLVFHPPFLHFEERTIISIILNGKNKILILLLSTFHLPFQLWMNEKLSNDTIRQKNFNRRIKQWKINIKGGRTMDNDISKP